MVTRAEEAQEESMICKICGDEVDEVYHSLECTGCGWNVAHGDCVEKYLKRIKLPGSQLSGYGCFNLKAGDIRRLDHEKINVNVCNLSGFLFDGGPDKEWAQKPFSREGKESRYFCPGKIKWTRQDIGRKKKIKAQPAPAPAQSKFSKQVQQQTVAAQRRLLESKMMMGPQKKNTMGAASSFSAAEGASALQDNDQSWITVGPDGIKAMKNVTESKDYHKNMISNDASVNNNKDYNIQVQKKQTPAVVAPGSGAAARMGANLNPSNGKKKNENQTFIPGMEQDQPVAAPKKKTKVKAQDDSGAALADPTAHSVNAMDGKEGFVTQLDRYNALIGSPISPLSPDDSIPDAEDDSKSVSEMSSIHNAAPFDISSLTDAQLAHAIAYGADSLAEFIPPEAIAFVEAILQNLRNDLPDEMDLIPHGYEEEEHAVEAEAEAHINKAPPLPVPIADLASQQNTPMMTAPEVTWKVQQPQLSPLHYPILPPSSPKPFQVQPLVPVPTQQPAVKTYDHQMLQTLKFMGFSENRSAHALIATGNSSIDAAMDFILAFQDDPSMDEPVPLPPPPLSSEPPPPITVHTAPWGPPQNKVMPSQAPSMAPYQPPSMAPYQSMIMQAQQQYQQQLAMSQTLHLVNEGPTAKVYAPPAPTLYAQPAPTLYAANSVIHTISVSGAGAQANDNDDDDVADLLALCGV